VHEVVQYWELVEKKREAVRLRGLWGEEEETPRTRVLLRPAKEAAEAGQFEVSR